MITNAHLTTTGTTKSFWVSRYMIDDDFKLYLPMFVIDSINNYRHDYGICIEVISDG
jgi:hypothetical protein